MQAAQWASCCEIFPRVGTASFKNGVGAPGVIAAGILFSLAINV
jgi:hypothetical protein